MQNRVAPSSGAREPNPVTGTLHHGFPHERLVDGVRNATTRIRLLGILSPAMDPSRRETFLDAMARALASGVDVRILVLDPQSRAADQCSQDLDHAVDVGSEVAEALRAFRSFRGALGPLLATRLDVRVYSALPPGRLHQWDDTAVTSLLSPDDWTGDGVDHHLTAADVGLARLLNDQFDGLWDRPTTRTLDEYFSVGLRLVTGPQSEPTRGGRPGNDHAPLRAPYVLVDRRLYVAETVEPVRLWDPDGEDPVVRIVPDRAPRGAECPRTFHAVRVDPGHPAMSGLAPAFRRKYGHGSPLAEEGCVVVRLDPTPETADRPEQSNRPRAVRGGGGGRGRRLWLLTGRRQPTPPARSDLPSRSLRIAT
jgi:hypothetical protein